MKKTGIYRITVKRIGESDRFYIGQSIDIGARKTSHFWKLRRGSHVNPAMQWAFDAHGEESFSFEILEVVDADRNILSASEKKHVDAQIAATGEKSLYNVHIEEMTSCLGVRRNDETKLRMSLAQRDKPRTDKQMETVAKMIAANRGRKLSAESIEKRTAKQKGMKRSDETKAKLALANIGKTHSEDTKKLISEKKKASGWQPTREHVEHLREINTGRPMHPNARAAILKAITGIKKSPEEIAKRQATRKANALAKLVPQQ